MPASYPKGRKGPTSHRRALQDSNDPPWGGGRIMVQANLYQKDIPSRTYRHVDEREVNIEITAPPHRPKSYRGKIRPGFLVYAITEKHTAKALRGREQILIYRR